MSERKFLKERAGFKVGDRVEVVNYYIKEFNGMTGTISKIDCDSYLNFDVILDNFTHGHDGHAGDLSTDHRFFSTKDLKLLSSTWHNVGDLVQVRSYLSTEKSYGGIYPSEQMLHKVGQKVRIKAVTKTGRYKIEGSCFTWTNEMFEEAKKETKVEPTKSREPKVGDRIRMTQNFCAAEVGMTGVIKFKREFDFAVEFDDEFVGGHSCSGQVKYYRGHYVHASHFEVIDTPEYSIATVTFDNDKEYCYLCDISVKKGDKVVVPCGTCDRETIATVVKTGKYTEENAPYPIDKMKKVIRKGTDTKPTSENGFDWDKFKKTEIIVHCRTQKSWDNFLEECEKRDIYWRAGNTATSSYDTWSTYKDEMSIVYGYCGFSGLGYASVDFHLKEIDGASVYDWTSKKYVDKPVEEKKVEDKPTPKIEVGDVVRAIDNYYGITSLANEWEGVVIDTTGNGFTALTTHAKYDQRASYSRFHGLDPKHFEIIKKNT